MNTGFALGTYPLPWTIERVGRRGVMIYSAIILTICMLVFVIMIGLPNPTLSMQWTAVAFVIIYNFVFGYGWIGVPWLYGPEVRFHLHLFTSRSSSLSPVVYILITNCYHRSRLSNSATSVALPAPSANGCSASLPSLLVELPCRMSAGRSGFGCSCPAVQRSHSCISCALR